MTDRYERQIQFKNIGPDGQQRLSNSRVLLCGCGALGSTVANSIVRAGVGTLRVVDFDLVDLTNLHRQMLYDESNARESTPKVLAAADRLRAINSDVRIEPYVDRVTEANVDQYLDGVDLILDGTDNFETRLLLNSAAIRHGIPWVYGGVLAAEGRVMPVLPGETACLRCLVDDVEQLDIGPTIRDVGVIGPIVEMVAALEVTEAMKILAGDLESVTRGLTIIDVWRCRFSTVKIPRRAGPNDRCPTCGDK